MNNLPRAAKRPGAKRRFGESRSGRGGLSEFDEDLEFYVLSREDTVLQKLRWFELGGRSSDRQWRDICSLLSIRRAELDLGYLTKVAEAAQLGQLLESALQQRGGA